MFPNSGLHAPTQKKTLRFYAFSQENGDWQVSRFDWWLVEIEPDPPPQPHGGGVPGVVAVLMKVGLIYWTLCYERGMTQYTHTMHILKDFILT